MGIPRHPGRVKLIAGLLFNDVEVYNAAKRDLVRRFGRLDFESEPSDFTYTTYYRDEMGGGLKRVFLAFERLPDWRRLYSAKAVTNRIEKRYSRDGRRSVNIDPGYIDLAKLVLFSTKDYAHRIYIGRSIYAEVTLFYKDNTFTAWPWTYPDYKSKEYLAIFQTIRGIYKTQIVSKGRVK